MRTTIAEAIEYERHLPLEGTYNVRDIGGYPTADGHRTRWRTILRADSLHRIPLDAQQTLTDLGLKTVVDLRRTHESNEWPNVFATSAGITYLNVPLVDGGLVFGTEWTLLDLYRAILDRRGEVLASIISALAEPDALPALIHCTAGKDRTGIVVALLLAIVGVPDDVIAADYELSSKFLVGEYLDEARVRASIGGYTWERYLVQLACPADYMMGALQHLDRMHDGVGSYLTRGGVRPDQLEALRHRLVE